MTKFGSAIIETFGTAATLFTLAVALSAIAYLIGGSEVIAGLSDWLLVGATVIGAIGIALGVVWVALSALIGIVRRVRLVIA